MLLQVRVAELRAGGDILARNEVIDAVLSEGSQVDALDFDIWVKDQLQNCFDPFAKAWCCDKCPVCGKCSFLLCRGCLMCFTGSARSLDYVRCYEEPAPLCQDGPGIQPVAVVRVLLANCLDPVACLLLAHSARSASCQRFGF